MKSYQNLLILIIIVLSFSACCKRTGYQEPVIVIKYSNFNRASFVYDIRVDKEDVHNVIDTIEIYGQNEYAGNSNTLDLKIQFELNKDQYHHVLMTSDFSRTDTIYLINVIRDKCDKIETQEHSWNGEYSTLTYREVTRQ